MFKAFIVDDDKYAVEAINMMFPWEELNITTIEKICSPDNLADRIIAEKPHLVFIDIEMGNVSGLDIISECIEQKCESHFIIVSGHDDFNYAYAAVNLGVIYYILKPIDYNDIENVKKKLKKTLLSDNNGQTIPDIPEFETSVFSNETYRTLWCNILKYIEQNYSQKILAQNICSEFFISPGTMYNLFRANINKTFIEYLTEFRIEKAKELLKTTSQTIPEIADAVGIKDPYYFNKVFKKHTGFTAINFKKKENIHD